MRVAPVDDNGDIELGEYEKLVGPRTRIVAPTGVGIVYGKQAILDAAPSWQGGGNMIADVTLERTLYQGPPARFEAGAGSIGDAVGLGAAIDYVEPIGLAAIERHEQELIEPTVAELGGDPGRPADWAPSRARRRGLVPHRRLPRRGCRQGARSGGHSGARRPSLRAADPAAPRGRSDGQTVVWLYNTHDDVDALAAAVSRIAIDKERPLPAQRRGGVPRLSRRH